MLKPWADTSSHEDLFLQRYERLLGWALQLADHNRQSAGDLLHDAFVQFTLLRPALDSIHNLDGYLFAVLRNLRLSQARAAARGLHSRHSLVSYDSAEIGLRALDLWAVDRRAQTQVRDELRLICHYACVRKETSKAGSVLLLRFFHGYYPSETAQLLRTPRAVVDNWLRLARREARLYLDHPDALAFVTKHRWRRSLLPGRQRQPLIFLMSCAARSGSRGKVTAYPASSFGDFTGRRNLRRLKLLIVRRWGT